MDIGGRRMSGFALGVLDSFQYFGTALALPATGRMLDRYGWGAWYPIMAGFSVVGVIAIVAVSQRQRAMAARIVTAEAPHRVSG
jgi:OPA family glycerol-3-phosphate transporter-like MFS transporter